MNIIRLILLINLDCKGDIIKLQSGAYKLVEHPRKHAVYSTECIILYYT